MNNELLKSVETNLEQLDLNSEVLSSELLTDVSSDTQAVNDRYRCPAKFLDIGVKRQLFADAGYFRFGSNITCYGRSSSGVGASRPDSSLLDAIADVSMDDGRLNFPFNPTEIIENLSLEQYVNGTAVA